MTLLVVALCLPGWVAAEAAVAGEDEAMRAGADAELAAVVAAGGPDAATAAYKRGWLAQRFDRDDEAVRHFEQSMKLDPSGRYAGRARLQARALSADGPARTARVDAFLEAVRAGDARDQRLRVYANAAAAFALALFVAVFAYRRGWRGVGAAKPWRGAAFSLYAFGGAAAIAAGSGSGWVVPLLLCGVCTAGIHVLAAAARASEPDHGPRWPDGVVAALATLGACYFVLAAFDRLAVMGL